MTPGSLVAVPELACEGVARLLGEKGTEAQLRFLASGAEMTLDQRRITRHCLLPRTRVRLAIAGGEAEGVIGAAPVKRDAKTGLMVYLVLLDDGREMQLREDALVAVPQPADPIQQLITASFHDLMPTGSGRGAPEPRGIQGFCAREELLAWRDRAWAATGGVVALAGARIEPLPHQLIVAQRVLTDRQVRFLLADEVGLGKTIEAGLIIQSLLAMRPTMRVLVVVPGALVSQWFLELYVRFGGRRFVMLDQERLRTWNGNPWKDEPFVLASSRAIEEMDAKSALRLAQSEWDMLVVDECHRMQPGGVLYKRIAVLSKSTPHVLLLSATPPRHHADAHLALLALLQPQVYRLDERKAFDAKLKAHDRVVALLTRTATAEEGEAAALAQEWRTLLGADAVLARLAAGLTKDFTAQRAALMAHVRNHYALDARLIRHRRQVLARLASAGGLHGPALAVRAVELVPYKPDAAELKLRAALRTYAEALIERFAPAGKPIPPRLAHWLLQLELAVAAHPRVMDRLLAMRAAVLEDPGAAEEYALRVQRGETTAQVLRSDLSENEQATHVAISAACHLDPAVEEEALPPLRAAAEVWEGGATPARTKALIARLKRFWAENPQEKVLVFTASSLAVRELAAICEDAFGDGAVETFGAHQDTMAREESARCFRDDDTCPLMISDPLGGEGRNFQFVSVVAHHDPPWSVAAVEQRIGRVDRIGRDGEVPSWVLAADPERCVDAAWCGILDRAVGVFTASTSGLEFVAGLVETRALDTALRGGGAALAAITDELAALVAAERTTRDQNADDLFHADAATFTAAAQQTAQVAAFATPRDAICRWMRAMGGTVKRDDEGARAFHLRARQSQQAQSGVFDRALALSRPDLAFFALGNELVDLACNDAAQARWCDASAWRRTPTTAVPRWDGLRVTWTFMPDLEPLVTAGLKPEDLRRLLVACPPRRITAFVRTDGVVEEDATVLALLTPPFDAKNGDTALSRTASREFWSRPMLLGKHGDVVDWQGSMDRAAAAAARHAATLVEQERLAAQAVLTPLLDDGLAAARAVAAGVQAQLPADHPDVQLARSELALEEQLAQALAAAVANARLDVAGAAYIAVA